MGYELKMKIGWISSTSSIENKNVKNRREYRNFFTIAEVDLSKIYYTATSKIAQDSIVPKEERNTKKLIYKWFDGQDENKEDYYGDMFTPVPLSKVIAALREDCEFLDYGDGRLPYQRFVWALSLCESVLSTDTENKFVVMFFGH